MSEAVDFKVMDAEVFKDDAMGGAAIQVTELLRSTND
jgi:hypothetical protein